MIDVSSSFSRFQAAVFDLDGTLIRSEHIWEAAKIEVLSGYGISPGQEMLDAYVGRGLGDFLEALVGHSHPEHTRLRMAKEIDAVADEMLPRLRGPMEGAGDLLRSLHEAGLRIGVCSSAARYHIEDALAELAIRDCVETIVSGAELSRGKPDPLPYLTTMAQLGLAPDMACAFEDSIVGATSAHKAGLSVFAIGEGCTDDRFSFCHHQAESYLALTQVA